MSRVVDLTGELEVNGAKSRSVGETRSRVGDVPNIVLVVLNYI